MTRALRCVVSHIQLHRVDDRLAAQRAQRRRAQHGRAAGRGAQHQVLARQQLPCRAARPSRWRTLARRPLQPLALQSSPPAPLPAPRLWRRAWQPAAAAARQACSQAGSGGSCSRADVEPRHDNAPGPKLTARAKRTLVFPTYAPSHCAALHHDAAALDTARSSRLHHRVTHATWHMLPCAPRCAPGSTRPAPHAHRLQRTTPRAAACPGGSSSSSSVKNHIYAGLTSSRDTS
jgi:hypothetical protein